MPFIEGWPHVRSCLLEGFHCIEIKLTMPFACRCQCGHCVAMDTNRESLCCCEIDRVVQKKEENESEVACIVNHDGFDPVCLNLWVLQAAYYTYRQRYGEPEEKEPHQ